MTRVFDRVTRRVGLFSRVPFSAARGSYQAYQILYVGFILLPLIAGLDKFVHLLANWQVYLAPTIERYLPISGDRFMLLVGVIEIAAGFLVAFRPRIGGYVVACWLWAIIINLLLLRGHYDIVLRDFGLSLGALALARLSQEFGR